MSKHKHEWTESVANSGPASILSYCASSILMTVTNKFVVNLDNFNMNFVMLFVQSLVCTVTLCILRIVGVANFRSLNRTDVKNWFPISLLLVLMIYTSSKSLQYLAVPIYTIFKNLTIILIAYGEVLFFGGKVTSMELTSFIMMVLSSVVATWGDQQAIAIKASSLEDLDQELVESTIFVLNPGYLWMFTNCISSALFVLIMRKRIRLTNFKDYDTMFYNNVLALPLLLVFSFIMEDWSTKNLSVNLSADSLAAMVISGLMSAGISYCSGWCVRVTSSTTYSMVGALNKLPIALAGLVFFDAPKNFLSFFSIFLGFLSGLLYAVAKQKKIQQQKVLAATLEK
ncbi:CPG_1a_G0014970.mRNA.1.CDS.1 [Saccharomyces cerevisiae]|nr:CPG_1a_G0014970.mRNA.1.CDS.1 [Saccharomyces cerevisiae]CAI7259592.1 CPG_1a_G0014970.mRNA.1.CDS.1 [Saccharomyces cerevisiae]